MGGVCRNSKLTHLLQDSLGEILNPNPYADEVAGHVSVGVQGEGETEKGLPIGFMLLMCTHAIWSYTQ